MSHVAAASLPVAIGLLVLTVAARLAAGADDERLARIARDHLGPLSTWCLILTAVHAAALAAAGQLGAGSGGVALIIAAAAVLLRTEVGPVEEEDSEATPEWARPAPAPGETAAPAPRSLWAEPDEDPARTGLWA